MDRRSWPWKKKSSEKAVTTAPIDLLSRSLSTSGGNQTDQDNPKGQTYVKISAESYEHLNELEDQVKILQQDLTSANENLSSAQSEITAKDVLVKQHAKVAEEAVSGWEKAEAEAATLKNQLETVILLKLTAEERASHLDGALKECMQQIRNVKEESGQKLHDVVFAKTKQWEKVKVELEVKISEFEQELIRTEAENAALSRSLHERCNMLMNISDEKSQADAEIEILKDNIQCCEKEINSFKFEFHLLSKELEIRNEEKNMSVRSAEVANKQRLEDVKKITKLEAECQRLRGLVRKKLPGPAALAQMKLEVENLGREYGDTRMRRSPARGSSPRHLPVPDFALENIQQCHKENDFLTERLLITEEEMKMLKEALSKRNSELQASRNMCAKTLNKLHSLETQMIAFNQQKSPSKPNIDIHFEDRSNPPSLTSMSEDGIDEEGSNSESWATPLVSELSHLKKAKDVEKGNKDDNLEIMDDFLEMERLASNEGNGTVSGSDGMVDNLKSEEDDSASAADTPKDGVGREQQPSLEPAKVQAVSFGEQSGRELSSHSDDVPLLKLQSRINSVFECQTHSNMSKVLEDIRCILQDTQARFARHSIGSVIEETYSTATCEQDHYGQTMEEASSGADILSNSNLFIDTKSVLTEDLKNAISQINNFVIFLGKEALTIPSSNISGLSKKIDGFSSSVYKVLSNELGINDLIFALSHILAEATEVNFNSFSDNHNERDIGSSECIDKVTLLENKVDQQEPAEDIFSGNCLLAHSSSDLEIDCAVDPGFELKTTLQKCQLEEFEQLKAMKESMEVDLTRYVEILEQTKLQLVEAEMCLGELEAQLTASERSNSLSETQLKCMAESYRSLESRTQELENEVNVLCAKAETLGNELQEEQCGHQDSLAKCRELQEQIERNEKLTARPNPSDTGVDNKTKQEKEIAAAAETLAECQETVLLLGKQLKAMRPPVEPTAAYPDNAYLPNDDILDDIPSPDSYRLHGMNGSQNPYQVEMESAAAYLTQTTGGDYPLDGYSSHVSPSDTESAPFPRSPMSSKRQKQRSSGSLNSSSSPNTFPDKHGRGFSRFFSKGA